MIRSATSAPLATALTGQVGATVCVCGLSPLGHSRRALRSMLAGPVSFLVRSAVADPPRGQLRKACFATGTPDIALGEVALNLLASWAASHDDLPTESMATSANRFVSERRSR